MDVSPTIAAIIAANANGSSTESDRDAEISAEQEEKLRAEHLARQREHIPARFRNARSDAPVPTGGVFLTGGVGSGKTHMAAAWALEAAAAGDVIHWVNAAAHLSAIRANFNGGPQVETPAEIARADLVVIDDLGAERPTEWVRESLYVLVDAIYEQERRLIVTSNLKLSQIARLLGERIASRLAEMCPVVTLDGPDRRRLTAVHRKDAAAQR
jgi:DNA replication protein DnaC